MRKEKNGISVHAIPGTHTVLFGMDATEEARRGLLGFALGKRKPSGNIAWMNGFKVFEETYPNPEPGTLKPTNEHPIQDFQWSDYNAEPGGEAADYVIRPLYGTPAELVPGVDIEMTVATLNAPGARHHVYFNRGTVPGQAFARQFGNTYPSDDEQRDPGNAKVKWLSRGLLEAALDFIGRASGPGFELKVAAYEFTYFPFLAALGEAALKGAKVKICVNTGDRRGNGDIYQDETSLGNWIAMLDENLKKRLGSTLPSMGRKGLTLYPRTWWAGIPHNKFMVLEENGHPVAVWTGSTNFTPSGFLGQSNLAHVIEDEGLARSYARYWETLAGDPSPADLSGFNTREFPDPNPLAASEARPIFSPRAEGILGWYSGQMAQAEKAGFLAAAFGISEEIGGAFTGDSNILRFVVAENSGRTDKAKAIMAAIEKDRDNIVAMGALLVEKSIKAGLEGEALDRWFLREERHRRQGNIFYIHTKMMMIDPFGPNPRVFSGSANFSSASVTDNDENMLLLSGDWAAEVTPVLVNEFIRLHRHLYFRTTALKVAGRGGGSAREAALLTPDDSWQTDHFLPGRQKFRKRELFR
jgi:phosphatidylserine/phosphatidylglycerophosphate/cardiolipin synthase-like enzyme